MFKTILSGALLLAAVVGASAAEVEVKMLNRGTSGVMVFEPALVRIAPGDTVKFVATDKSHNAESIRTMLPAGAEPFVGAMNQDVTVTFQQPGVYGIMCKPHYGMGMVALVVVGEPVNLQEAAAARHPGRARQVFADLIAKAQ